MNEPSTIVRPYTNFDCEGYFDFPSKPPLAVSGLCQHLDFIKMTAAPPLLQNMPIPDADILNHIDEYSRCLRGQQQFRFVTNRAHLEPDTLKRCGVILALQNSPEDPRNFRAMFDRRVRIIQLAYEAANRYGTGWGDQTSGLTADGKLALMVLKNLGMTLDLAHASRRMASDILDFLDDFSLDLPVIVSHTGVFDLYDHERNFPLEILVRIAKRGGIIGLFTLTFCLHPSDDSLEPFLRHLKALIGACGIEHVGIGSDGTYRRTTEAELMEHFERMGRIVNLKKFRARPQDHPMVIYDPEKMLVLYSLIARIFGEEAAKRVIGLNWLTFFRNNLPA